jgi:hypothetical protein
MKPTYSEATFVLGCLPAVAVRGSLGVVLGGISAAGGFALLAWLTRNAPGWVTMWSLAGALFLTLKAATLRGCATHAHPARVTAYVVAWPGMNAARFLRMSESRTRAIQMPGRPAASAREFGTALGKLGMGLALAAWTVAHAYDSRVMLVGWVGMLALIFMLHFGALHLVSWFWRRAGIDAPPIMRAPIKATALAELWGERWNLAFADAARHLIVRPLARRWGVRVAGAMVFFFSGLIHEAVISLPARGGWGGPTLYFLVQAAGVASEKSATGRRLGLGRGVRGWLWTFVFAVAPLPLLFHGPFTRNVIVPFYHVLANLLLP